MYDKLIQDLEDIGLSPAEAQVYLTLSKLNLAKAGQIIPRVSLSSSNVHEALEKLAKRGLISYTIKNNIKEYHAVKPEMLSLLVDEKKEEIKFKESKLDSLIKELSSIEKISKISQNAEIFIGFNGLKSGFRKLLTPRIKNKEFVFFYKYDKDNVSIVHEFFFKMDKEDYYTGINSRAIFTKEYKKIFKQRKNNIKVKFTDYPIPSSINIYDDKVLIIAWQENPIAFLIQSKEVAETFYNLFDSNWNMAEK